MILSLVIIVFAFLFSVHNPDAEKMATYECGFEPYEDARSVFDVRFYLVAMLFIVFDIETLYFFPWCISYSQMDISGFWGMLDFVVELLAGYIYIWHTGALRWD